MEAKALRRSLSFPAFSRIATESNKPVLNDDVIDFSPLQDQPGRDFRELIFSDNYDNDEFVII